MFKRLEKLYRMIYPPFLKKWEDWMLVRYPALWGMALPAILFFGAVLNILATAFVWLFPIDSDNLPTVEFWTFTALVVGIVLMVIWMVYSAKFDPAIYFGDRKTFGAKARPFVYPIAVALLMGPAGTIYFQFNIRIGLLSDTEQFKRDLEIVRNYDAFRNGGDGVGHDRFVEAVTGKPSKTGPSESPIVQKLDTNQIMTRLIEIEAKYDGKVTTSLSPKKKGNISPKPESQVQQNQLNSIQPHADFPMAGNLPKIEVAKDDSLQPPLDSMVVADSAMVSIPPEIVEVPVEPEIQQEVKGLSVDTATIRKNFSEYSVISNSTVYNVKKMERVLKSRIHEDWFDWLVFMATIGVMAAFFIAVVEFSARYLGGWYGIVTIAGMLAGAFVILIIGTFSSVLTEAILVEFFPRDPVTGQSAVAVTMSTLLGGIPLQVILVLILNSMVRKRLKRNGSRRLAMLLSLKAGMLFSLVVAILLSLSSYGSEAISGWSQLGMTVLFGITILAYVFGVPYLKNRFYSVYLLPK